MEEAISTLSPTALAGLLVAYLMAASRIAGPLAPLWARLPAPWPQLAPAIMALLPQVADAFRDVNTWQSFAVSVATAIGLVLPGIMPKPAEPPGTTGRGGGVIPPGPLTGDFEEKTPPSLPGARMVALCALLLFGCARMADPCSEVSLATITAGCEARIEQECAAGDRSCKAYLECSKAIKTWRSCQ